MSKNEVVRLRIGYAQCSQGRKGLVMLPYQPNRISCYLQLLYVFIYLFIM